MIEHENDDVDESNNFDANYSLLSPEIIKEYRETLHRIIEKCVGLDQHSASIIVDFCILELDKLDGK